MAGDKIVDWHSSYSVGIPLVDEQHKELINLTNKLYQGCMTGREVSKQVFLQTIRGAVDYIGYHFTTEEKIMIRINYPGYGTHKKEHTDFVKEVLSKIDDFNSGKIFTPNAFVHYLKDWVLTHIAVCDKKMGDFLIEMKKDGSLGKMTLKVKQDSSTGRFIIQ
jgi:hemerythrin